MRKSFLNAGRLCLLLFPLLAGTAQAFFFRLDGDHLWLQAENTPLVEILAAVHVKAHVRLFMN